MQSVSHSSFVKISSKYCLSQAIRAGELKFWENCHPPPHITCHVPCVTFNVSCVICHMSLFYSINFSFFGKSGGARWLMVCYVSVLSDVNGSEKKWSYNNVLDSTLLLLMLWPNCWLLAGTRRRSTTLPTGQLISPGRPHWGCGAGGGRLILLWHNAGGDYC